MAEKVTVAVDALGGDAGAPVVLNGVAAALKSDSDIKIILCGPEDVVVPFADAHERCVARVTTEEIAMDEHPAQAVRKKKDSSIVVGCRLVKEGSAQGFFSAGSTGACLTAATLVTGRIKGVVRPALATIIPSPIKPAIMCDVGANADCKPNYLLQFAQMASIYAEEILEVKNPRVALLNIGEEETKGSQLALEAHELLKKNLPNFVGNAEGRDLLTGSFDVFVTDGFTGNVCLKTLEGAMKVLLSTVKDLFMSSFKTKMAGLAVKGDISELKNTISPDAYGGAPLLGVKGACIVGHGSSNEEAIKNGILITAKTVRLDVLGRIEQVVSKSQVSE